MTTNKDKALIDVFTTACEGGINYWAGFKSYHWCLDNSGSLDKMDYENFEAKIVFFDERNYEPVTINREAIERGIDELAKRLVGNDFRLNNYHTIAILELWKIVNAEGNLDYLDFDADTADLIVQHGLFGEIIYG
jgi:hypothetical protein